MGSVYKPTYRDKKTGEEKESSVYWIAYYRNGVQLRESAKTAVLKEAKTLLNLREGDVAKGVPVTARMGRIKFSEMAADMVNDYKKNRHRSLVDLEAKLKLHLLPFFGDSRASSITTDEIRRYVTKRQAEGAKNGTINRELAALKRSFSLAVEAQQVMVKPHIELLKENNVRTGFFEWEQFESVRNHLPEDLKPVATFSYITGWRKGEVLNLQWPQVDFGAGFVRLEPGTTKNDEARMFPLTQDLRTVLESQRVKTDTLKKKGVICPWVFHRGGKRIRYFRRAWKTACVKAGVPGHLVHDFRRTAVRNLVRAGVPERVAMKLTGHKTRSVFDRYNIVSEGDLRDAAHRLDAISQSKSRTKSAKNDETTEQPVSVSALKSVG